MAGPIETAQNEPVLAWTLGLPAVIVAAGNVVLSFTEWSASQDQAVLTFITAASLVIGAFVARSKVTSAS